MTVYQVAASLKWIGAEPAVSNSELEIILLSSSWHRLSYDVCLEVESDIIARIQQRRLQYFGRVVRMDQGRYPKLALEGYVHGKRNRERPKRRWLDRIKEDLVLLNMRIQEATCSGGSTLGPGGHRPPKFCPGSPLPLQKKTFSG